MLQERVTYDRSDREGPQCEVARTVERLATQRWGARQQTAIVGRHERLVETLERVARFATAGAPVLISGETGTGKELFARALYLLSDRSRTPFLTVNCAQYRDGQLMASELFGHKRGSFTGAVADHRGVFEEANGGVVFLDEVGELAPAAQAMLLRALSEGEVVPVGGTHAQPIDVRAVAATSRDLAPMIDDGRFRADLYFRLRYLHVRVPPVRERGDDWRLILEFYLGRLNRARSAHRAFSREALQMLRRYHWPGNVRELRSLVDTGFFMSDGELIEPQHFAEALEAVARDEQLRKVPLYRDRADLYARLTSGEGDFWELVHHPFMDRELSRTEVRQLVDRGLRDACGSYKRLLALFGVAQADYLKFMDFLRHHQLKPLP